MRILKTVNQFKPGATDFDTVVFPVVFIYAGPSKKDYDEIPIGYEGFGWTIFIELYVENNTDIETLLSDVHKELFENNTFGDLANLSYIESVDPFEAIIPDRSLRGIIIDYYVKYMHPQGMP